MNNPEYAIQADNLHKTYKSAGKMALDDVSLKVPTGSIFALLGPNGAGKSTFINILAGLVIKDSGYVRIWNSNIDEEARQSRASIGIVPQELNLDAFFTPREVLETQAGFYGVAKKDRITEELLEAVGLTDKADAKARTLSGGMKRRVMVAKAMVHRPPVLVLDEPTAGVDIELRKSLWNYVRKLNDIGTTIILTTHYLEEAEELCDKIAIINHGKLIKCDDKNKILKDLDSKQISFTFAEEIKDIPASITKYNPVKTGSNILKFTYAPSKTEINDFLLALNSNNMNIIDISTKEGDLEEAFLKFTK